MITFKNISLVKFIKTIFPAPSRVAIILGMIFLPASAWSFQYGGGKCDFRLDFPAAPSLKNITWQGGQSYEQAEFIGDSYFLRAECIPMGKSAINAEQLMPITRKFAENEGLTGTAFSTSNSNLGPTVVARGRKLVKGVPTTYEYRCSIGLSSTLCLTGGAPSHEFPNFAIDRFFQSTVVVEEEKIKMTSSTTWTSIRNGAYLNFNSIQYGKTTKAWVLIDNGVVVQGALSLKVQYEVDCTKELSRTVAVLGFKEPVGEGDLLFSDSTSKSKWTPAPPTKRLFFGICSAQHLHDKQVAKKIGGL